MQFFETIEGRSGEELTSSVLKFLLVNSAIMRERFVARLRPYLPPSKTPTFRDGIICQCEVGTSKNGIAGRIDLLIREEAGMILGVENKFWAEFTHGQPKKYWDDLVDLAGNKKENCRLVLLIPEARKSEVDACLEAQGIKSLSAIVFWENVREDLEQLASQERSDVGAIARFLHDYVGRRVLETRVDVSPEQLVGRDVTIPNDFHYDFLYQMKSCLPEPERIRPAKSWIGFGFSVAPSAEAEGAAKQWFGFYRASGHTDVVMGIDTGMPDFAMQPLSWARVTEGFGSAAFVEIDYDGSVATTLEWKERLEPILESLSRACESRLQTHIAP